MAEEFQGELVCGGNWWNSSKSLFDSSPCSPAVNAMGGLAWPDHDDDAVMDVKTTRSSDNSAGSCASDGSSTSSSFLQSVERSQLDSTLQMMGISFPSSTIPDDWNQDFQHDTGRLDENYSPMIQEPRGLNPSMNNQQPLNSMMMNSPTNLPLNSASYCYTSSLLQTLFDADSDQSEHSLLDNQRLDFPSATNPQMNNNSTELFSTKASLIVKPFWNATASASGDIPATFIPSSTQSLIYPSPLNSAKNHCHEAQYVASMAKNLSREPAFKRPRLETPSPLPTFKNHCEEAQYVSSMAKNLSSEPAFKCPRLETPSPLPTFKNHCEESQYVSSMAKNLSSEPAFKCPRLETPSPLPTFKVRKEKLGDRITALQQLVSPFGKTDTASVLHEAVDYIKFLHDKVNVLSTPYRKKWTSSNAQSTGC